MISSPLAIIHASLLWYLTRKHRISYVNQRQGECFASGACRRGGSSLARMFSCTMSAPILYCCGEAIE